MKKCDCSCKCNFTDSLKESSAAVWLFGICAFLLGIIVGFWWSPVKNGITIGSNNKSYENDNCAVSYNGDDEEEWNC